MRASKQDKDLHKYLKEELGAPPISKKRADVGKMENNLRIRMQEHGYGLTEINHELGSRQAVQNLEKLLVKLDKGHYRFKNDLL